MTATSQPDLCLPTKHRCKQCNVKSTEIFINPAQKSAGECAGGNHSQVWEQALLWAQLRWLSIMSSLLLPPSLLQLLLSVLLLGSGLVSWACLRWRFGLTTKGLHFQRTADSAERTCQNWRVCALQDRSGQATAAAREGWFRLPETWSKNLVHTWSPSMLFWLFCLVFPLQGGTTPSLPFAPYSEEAVQRRNCWILEFSPVPDFPLREDHLNLCFEQWCSATPTNKDIEILRRFHYRGNFWDFLH